MSESALIPAGVANLLALKGQIATFLTERDCKVRKGMPQVRKRSRFQCRVGVNYDNIQAVKDGREDGTKPAENAGLPWGEWLIFPYVIAHKGNHYFRCTSINSTMVPQVQFLLDGAEITRERAKELCLASEFGEKDGEVFTVKVESILEVNGKAV